MSLKLKSVVTCFVLFSMFSCSVSFDYKMMFIRLFSIALFCFIMSKTAHGAKLRKMSQK
jgi:hypothetical protein